MRRSELDVLRQLRSGPRTVTELSEAIDRSQGWTSELVADLEEQNLVRKGSRVELADNYETRLLTELMDRYDLTLVLTGKKEEILESLLEEPKTVPDLAAEGFASSTLYESLNDLQARGVVAKSDAGEYEITDDTLGDFLGARNRPPAGQYTAGDARITRGGEEGRPTAFSAFGRYGLGYYPRHEYRYIGEEELGLEEVLIHAVRVAESKKQTAMCAVFFLKHRGSLDSERLWTLANRWDCVEKWADVQAFLDRREVHDRDLFLPWEEFTTVAREYGVYPRGKHPEDSLLTGLDGLGETLDREVDVYLLGGGNLILRELKDSTKDIDVVVEDEQALVVLVEALEELGYEQRRELEEVYERMNPSIVLEKQGSPRWDVFVEVVADNLRLTEGMKHRADLSREFSGLTVHLLSLTDIFLFKAITDREGDLEDCALIARQADLDWQGMFEEIRAQEEATDRLFSFSVLDTLDVLEQRHGIRASIHDRLVSYCLENALLLSVNYPALLALTSSRGLCPLEWSEALRASLRSLRAGLARRLGRWDSPARSRLVAQGQTPGAI